MKYKYDFQIEVYPNEETKPPIGKKLNKTAKLKFYIDLPSNNIYNEIYFKELCKE